MELYLNNEKVDVIKYYFEHYPLDGVTTNPKMIGALGKVDYAETLRSIRAVIGPHKKLFTQVTSDKYEDILREGEFIASIAGKESTYIKVPANEVGIMALRTLHERGYHTLATLCYTSIQAVMALQAGVDYVALFYNYMEQAGFNVSKTLTDIAAYIKESGCPGKLMGVGVRNQEQLSDCFGCGCQAVNLNADSITAWMLNAPSVETTKNFMAGWIKTWGDTRIIDFIK